MGKRFFVLQGKKRRNAGCISRFFQMAGQKSARTDGIQRL